MVFFRMFWEVVLRAVSEVWKGLQRSSRIAKPQNQWKNYMKRSKITYSLVLVYGREKIMSALQVHWTVAKLSIGFRWVPVFGRFSCLLEFRMSNCCQIAWKLFSVRRRTFGYRRFRWAHSDRAGTIVQSVRFRWNLVFWVGNLFSNHLFHSFLNL